MNIVRILVANTPQLYTISKQKDDIQVYLVGSLNPSARKDRNKCLVAALGNVEAQKNAGITYIDAKLITVASKPKYKSAVELMAKNVVRVMIQKRVNMRPKVMKLNTKKSCKI